MIRRSRDCLGR